jgi:hypothetical protein
MVLTPAQSAAIRESGIGFVTGAPSRTDPGTLLLFECDRRTATAAARVALGTHRAVQRKPATVQPQHPARP